MPERPLARLNISNAARRDIAGITAHSLKYFGEAAALRYKALIGQALEDLRSDPIRPGSQKRSDVPMKDARTYHLSYSRDLVLSGSRVKDPRHLLLYRIMPGNILQIARILHDSRDIKRHVPREFKSGD